MGTWMSPTCSEAPECGVCVLRCYICTKVCPLNLIFPIKITKLIFKPKPAYIPHSEAAESKLMAISCN